MHSLSDLVLKSFLAVPAYMETNLSQSHVFEWYPRLCDGRRSLGDEKGPGRKGSSFSGRNVS